jgi:hypothetical protein
VDNDNSGGGRSRHSRLVAESEIELGECIIAENEQGTAGYALHELELFDLGFVSIIYVAPPQHGEMESAASL